MAAPANTVLPAVTGTLTLDMTLTCSTGTWTDDGSPTFTYQWQAGFADGSGGYSDLPGKTASTIVLTDDLQYYKLRCKVTDTDSGGATTATSAATAVWIGHSWPLGTNPTEYLDAKTTDPRNSLFYVGDTVSIPRQERFLVTDPHWSGFEAGVSGDLLATTDDGVHNPFSFVANCTYDNTHARGGSLSAKIPGTGGGSVQIGQSVPFANGDSYGRFCHYATANPNDTSYPLGGAILVYMNDLQPGGGGVITLCINKTGHLLLTGQTAFTTAIPLNQWYRIEYHAHFETGNSSVTLRLYTGSNDTVAAEEHTYTGLSSVRTIDPVHQMAVSHGVVAGSWLSDTWMDDIVVNASDWVGVGDPVEPPITNSYEVRDYYGNVVSSGTYIEYVCEPTPPVGGWKPGWYRIYFMDGTTRTRYGPSIGVTQFAVLRDNPNFPHLPAGAPGSGTGLSDIVFKAALGATSRFGIDDVTSAPDIALVVSDAAYATTYYTPYSDPHRPRYLWSNAVSQTYDYIAVLNGVAFQSWGWITTKDGTQDGSQVFVTVTAGTSLGNKVKVFYPDSTTLVETYDNIASAASAETTINAASNYIHFVLNEGGTPTLISTPTAIGNTYFNATKDWVTDAYAAGVTRFEGPTNEPQIDSAANGRRQTQTMRLFQAAVHAANPSAKAIGPCPVFIQAAAFDFFLSAGGGAYCDEFAVHTYNAINGDLNQGRTGLQAFVDVIAAHGYSSKPIWQTEATSGPPLVGTFVPHKLTRWLLLDALLLEQFGIPREQNNPWYDISNGFWGFPAFLATFEGAPMPHAVVWRVLAEETYGKPFASKLDFGTPGNNIFLGSIYTDPDDGTSVVVVMPTSALHNGKVTLTISGTSSPLTAVDTFGVESTVAITDGKVSIDTLYAAPMYLRLPAGASATVFSCNDWTSTAITKVTASSAKVGSTTTVLPNDGLFMGSPYTGASDKTYVSTNALPEAITLTLSAATEIDRIILWSGAGWQSLMSIIKFDIDVSNDGSSWTTVKTVDTSAQAVSFKFGAGGQNTGTQWDTYWPEQWAYDESFDPVTAQYVRVNVHQASWGGFPDFQSVGGPFRNFGGSPEFPSVAVQELQVFTGSTAETPPPPPPPPDEVARSYRSFFIDNRVQGNERRDLWAHGFVKGGSRK